MFYFISDTHFGHSQIIKSRSQFQSIEEMDEFIISRYNSRVYRDDVVYITGDYSFRSSKERVEYSLKQLRGRKILVTGNHDDYWIKRYPELLSYFEEVYFDYHVLPRKMKGRVITVCHFPLLEFRGSRDDTGYCIHGHIHDMKSDTYYFIKEHQQNCLNCGVDINNYMPVTLDELIVNNNDWYQR